MNEEMVKDYIEWLRKDVISVLALKVIKTFGDPGMKVVKDAMWESGVLLADRVRDQLESNDAVGAGKLYATAYDAYGGQNIKYEVKDGTVITRCSLQGKCPFGLENTNFDWCKAIMEIDRSLIENLCKDAELVITKSVAVGDPNCEQVTRTKAK